MKIKKIQNFLLSWYHNMFWISAKCSIMNGNNNL